MNTAAGSCEPSWPAENNPRVLTDQKLNLSQQILNTVHKWEDLCNMWIIPTQSTNKASFTTVWCFSIILPDRTIKS